jgi:hypothetical protein
MVHSKVNTGIRIINGLVQTVRLRPAFFNFGGRIASRAQTVFEWSAVQHQLYHKDGFPPPQTTPSRPNMLNTFNQRQITAVKLPKSSLTPEHLLPPVRIS